LQKRGITEDTKEGESRRGILGRIKKAKNVLPGLALSGFNGGCL